MKVEQSHNNRIVQKQTENAAAIERNQKALDNERADRMANKDQASLSENARILAKARVNFDEIPDINTDRVNQLKEQINSGNYQVPVEQLASLFMRGLRP